MKDKMIGGEHFCTLLNTFDIRIKIDNHNSKWILEDDKHILFIRYCPYCGEYLYGDD